MVMLSAKDDKGNTIVSLDKDDVLIFEGTTSDGIYFVKEGSLGVFKRRGGGDVQIGTVHSGELVGEMSFLDNEPRCATVKALGECKLIEIPSAKFKEIQSSQPKWYQTLVLTLLERLRRSNAKIKV